MDDLRKALAGWFDARNRAWVTGDVSDSCPSCADAQQAQHWLRDVELKRQDAALRGGRVLRAHTQVIVHRAPLPDSGNAPDAPADAVVDQRLPIIAIVQEHIAWVLRNGGSNIVEARSVGHRQRWQRVRGGWKLLDDDVSSEERDVADDHADTCAPAPPFGVWADGLRPADATQYDRVRAERYANLWWEDGNPSFLRLRDDCANFASQCLLAGRWQMVGGQNRKSGWWYRFDTSASGEHWSYSWTTAHALYLFLTQSGRAQRVESPRELKVGDIILYDWGGSGRFGHTTIVVDFDDSGDPLVNAHTVASYHRHYLYRDSPAWTPSTRYALLHLADERA